MAPGQGPLHEAAKRIGQLGTQFYDLSKRTAGWPWPFSGISPLFFFCYEKAYWAASEFERADQRFEGMRIDELRDHPVAWLLLRMGAHPFWAYFYEHNPWGWITQRIHTALPMLRRLETDPWYWIREKLIQRYPGLSGLFNDPRGWVRSRIEEVWGDFLEIRNHPVPWVLKMLGAHPFWAYYYENNPWGWVIQELHTVFPFLRTLYTDPQLQIWEWFEGAVDRFIHTRIDWLVRTCGRVINMIWEARI